MNWRPEGWRNPNYDASLDLEYAGENLDAGRAIELGNVYEVGADAILEASKKEGIKGEVKACCNPVAMPDGDVSFDDFDTNFISEDKELEVCLNGAEDIVYGKQVCHIITPKKGWLVFIPDETNKEVKE